MSLNPDWLITNTYDENSNVRCLTICYPTNGGRLICTTFNADLAESPSRLRLALLQKGAKLVGTKAAQEAFVADLLKQIPPVDYILTAKPGFRGDGFILGSQMLGSAENKYQWENTSKNQNIGKCAGAFKEWQTDVAAVAARSTFAALGILIALAGCLPSYVRFRLANTEGLRQLLSELLTFNFWGASSSGKTSIGRVTASVSGAPDPLLDWDFSRRGLEECCAAHNDLVLVLDDIEKHTGTEMSLKTAMQLVNQCLPKGQSKAIAEANRDKYPALTWSAFGITSSPRPFDEIAADNGWKRSLGEKVRLIDLPVPEPDQAGIFDRLKGTPLERRKQGAALIKQLEHGLSHNYGHLMEHWVQHLLRKNRAMRVQELVDHFVRRKNPINGYEERLATKFGIVYAAGKIAVAAGLLPWDKKLPWKVASKAYRLALTGIMTDDARAKAHLKTLAQSIGTEAFLTVPPAKHPVIAYKPNTIGLLARYKGQNVCAIRDEQLHALAGTKSLASEMRAQLSAAGALMEGQGHAGTGQLPISVKIGDRLIKKPRFWLIAKDKLRASVGA